MRVAGPPLGASGKPQAAGEPIGYSSAEPEVGPRLLTDDEWGLFLEAHTVGPVLLAHILRAEDAEYLSVPADDEGRDSAVVGLEFAAWDPTNVPMPRASSFASGLLLQGDMDLSGLIEGYRDTPSPRHVARIRSLCWLDPLASRGADLGTRQVTGREWPVSLWQPALTAYEWVRADEAGGWLVGSDDGFTTQCSYLFLLGPRGRYTTAWLPQALRLPHRIMFGLGAKSEGRTLVTESYTQPSKPYLDAFDRSAGLSLVRLTAPGEGGTAVVEVLFTPALGDTSVELLIAYSFDPFTGDCVYATAAGDPLAQGGKWKEVRLHECGLRGSPRLIAVATLRGTHGIRFEPEACVPTRGIPPSPIPRWLQRTAAGNVVMIDADLNVWRWHLADSVPSTSPDSTPADRG